jgi:DNA-binding LacI/PurR family transcriptional regulator
VPVYISSQAVGPNNHSLADQARQICRYRPRAVICNSNRIGDDVLVELGRYQAAGGTVVMYDFPVPFDCDSVVFDREHNSYQVARYLLERGHRRIGFALDTTFFWHVVNHRVPQPERLAGFTRAMNEFGLEVRPENLFEHGAYDRGGLELAHKFLGLDERPTAMCIVNDIVALAFMSEVMRNGVRIPEDLSVIGHDDWPIAAYCPVPLTSGVQPGDQIAKAVVDTLVDRLGGKADSYRKTFIRGGITERQSVARVTSAD